MDFAAKTGFAFLNFFGCLFFVRARLWLSSSYWNRLKHGTCLKFLVWRERRRETFGMKSSTRGAQRANSGPFCSHAPIIRQVIRATQKCPCFSLSPWPNLIKWAPCNLRSCLDMKRKGNIKCTVFRLPISNCFEFEDKTYRGWTKKGYFCSF